MPHLNGSNDDVSDVCVVGAGPAGLMLADNLARFGIQTNIVDERPDQTSFGRADGLQPKTIETLRMLRLADDLIRVSTKVYDICIRWQRWLSTRGTRDSLPGRYRGCPRSLYPSLPSRNGRRDFYQVHEGKGRGGSEEDDFPGISVIQTGLLEMNVLRNGRDEIFQTRYIVGCDGAHSKVRQTIPGATPQGNSSESVWGVLDGELDTDFPDIWSKTIIAHPQYGAVLIIPRERAMTRFYIEIKADSPQAVDVTEKVVMDRARQICAPYKLDWKTVEWFGKYQIRQRVANKFMDDEKRVFIAGDASHTHSPKAAQGMNTSIHDSWNLAWKLNLELRGLAKPTLLQTYEVERKKIAHDLINFDYEHTNQISSGNSEALAENFRTNIRFIAGVGVEYAENVLNNSQLLSQGALKPGSILPHARAIRYIDHNAVDVQLDIPILGQFRIYTIVRNVVGISEKAFLESLSKGVTNSSSLLSRISDSARKSYKQKPRVEGAEDVYFRHGRYTPVSDLFTFGLITTTQKSEFELRDLPSLYSRSPWTIYLDGAGGPGSHESSCVTKWIGDLQAGEVAVVNVRPDNYVGSVSIWNSTEEGTGLEASQWLDKYYGGFLQV